MARVLLFSVKWAAYFTAKFVLRWVKSEKKQNKRPVIDVIMKKYTIFLLIAKDKLYFKYNNVEELIRKVH